MSPEDVDVETVRKALVLYENLTAWPGQATAAAGTHKQAMSAIRSLTNLEARLRTAEAERDALIEGAANVGMERDMANAENARLREALEQGRCLQCGSWFRDMPEARTALSVDEPERSE